MVLSTLCSINDIDWPLLAEISSRTPSSQGSHLPPAPPLYHFISTTSFSHFLKEGVMQTQSSEFLVVFFIIMASSLTLIVQFSCLQRPLWKGGSLQNIHLQSWISLTVLICVPSSLFHYHRLLPIYLTAH